MNSRKRLDEMLILDFIIVNSDRHFNNFGVIRDTNTLKLLDIAPIFDNGTSLWCNFHETQISSTNEGISQPFKKSHLSQIDLVKDFSFLNLNALDGIENLTLKILNETTPKKILSINRNIIISKEIKKRVELLKKIIKEKTR
jgi:hypothetical protein